MKQKVCIIVLLSLLSFVLHAQKSTYTYKAVYKLEYAPDSTNMAHKLTDYWVLLMNENSSFFTSEKFMRMDSAKRAEKQRGNNMGPSMDWYNVNGTKNTLVIFRSGTIMECHEKLEPRESEHFTYKENEELEWVLNDDTLRIGQHLCYKAALSYGGRKWIAWYNPEVALESGPFKFFGLPGLIYQIEDQTGSWKYSLVSIEKRKIDLEFNCSESKHQATTKKEFFVAKRNHYKNGVAIWKARGYQFDERDRQKRLDSDNNWIELYL